MEKGQPIKEDENCSNELKKTALCDSCAGIQRNWRRALGHAELLQGKNRQEELRESRFSSAKRSLVTITSYRCDRCGTAWEYENNKSNQKAGWSVVSRRDGLSSCGPSKPASNRPD